MEYLDDSSNDSDHDFAGIRDNLADPADNLSENLAHPASEAGPIADSSSTLFKTPVAPQDHSSPTLCMLGRHISNPWQESSTELTTSKRKRAKEPNRNVSGLDRRIRARRIVITDSDEEEIDILGDHSAVQPTVGQEMEHKAIPIALRSTNAPAHSGGFGLPHVRSGMHPDPNYVPAGKHNHAFVEPNCGDPLYFCLIASVSSLTQVIIVGRPTIQAS